MRILQERAPAKINLTLDVLCKRADGYHDLQSIMQSVHLEDEIILHVGTGCGWELTCNGGNIPCDERNLAWKAAKIFCEAMSWDPNGLKIVIHKSIPSEAGLGGGSSDGAAVLRALNRCVPNPLSPMELADLGSKVGSDVPFCVLGGTAFCEGRGERLTPLSVAPKFSYVLCKPDLAFSTPKLFAKLDSAIITKRPDHNAMVSALQMGDADTAGRLLCNVFEEAVLDEYPAIQEIKTLLIEQGACGASMTGSGSVVYGIFPSEETAVAATDGIKNRYPNTFFCKTV